MENPYASEDNDEKVEARKYIEETKKSLQRFQLPGVKQLKGD
jgi:hypothetical protein